MNHILRNFSVVCVLLLTPAVMLTSCGGGGDKETQVTGSNALYDLNKHPLTTTTDTYTQIIYFKTDGRVVVHRSGVQEAKAKGEYTKPVLTLGSREGGIDTGYTCVKVTDDDGKDCEWRITYSLGGGDKFKVEEVIYRPFGYSSSGDKDYTGASKFMD